ncbi:MAG: hypothetical protein Q8881_03330 [Sweet potato little leaf phytoplasma]|nr:hypothetical protein [Sweet potato little leaf phytoplasma]
MGTFPQNGRINPAEFRTRDVSAETAESILPNFHRISHLGHFRRNGRIKPTDFPPNFVLGTFPAKRPNQSRRILH